MKKGCAKNILKAEYSPGLSPAASALHSKKKRSLQKKVTCKSVLAAQVRKGREGMSPFHYTRPVTVCADTGIHKKKGDFGNLLKQII
jgi:hypothetical protein